MLRLLRNSKEALLRPSIPQRSQRRSHLLTDRSIRPKCAGSGVRNKPAAMVRNANLLMERKNLLLSILLTIQATSPRSVSPFTKSFTVPTATDVTLFTKIVLCKK